MTQVELSVHGVPAPQGSKTPFNRGGKTWVVEGGSATGRQKHADWRQAVATAARDWVDANGSPPALDGPLEAEITFWMPKPKSAPKYKVYPTTKPDLDKLERAVFDSLSGLVITDDARVVRCLSQKLYAIDRAPGAHVIVWTLEEIR